MELIVGARGSGKTERMFEWMRAAPEGGRRVCICFSANEAMRLLRLSRERGYDLESWQFVGPDGAFGLRGRQVEVGIDNVDLWLQHHFGYHVGAVSLTSPDRSGPV